MKIFKLELNIPKKSSIAILDYPGANLIKKTLNLKNIPIISLRSIKINLYILLLSFFENYKYKKGQRYIISYIKFIKPNIVISNIDNNHFFYNLKKIFPKIIFIFIQNGTSLADYTKDEIKKLNWKADYFFSYSKSFSKIYSSIFKKKVEIAGSFKNNLKKVSKKKNKKNLVYISQFTKSNYPEEKIKSGKIYFSSKKFYEAEKKLLPILHNFCLKKNLKLIISGRNFSQDESIKEKTFYNKILLKNKIKENSFTFYNIKNEFSSYDLIDKAQLVVFIDSALGYQSLARNNVSFACCLRSELLKNKSLGFGWPEKFANEGPFWINYFSKNKIEKKLEFLYNLSPSTWRKIYQKQKDRLLTYDSGNQNFKKIVKKHVN